jgi:hypothetical protein
MYLIFQHILLVGIGSIVIGSLSAAFVVLIAWLLRRGGEMRLETALRWAGLVGLVLWGIGSRVDSLTLTAVSVLLWGWIMLPILLVPLVPAWRLLAWLERRSFR